MHSAEKAARISLAVPEATKTSTALADSAGRNLPLETRPRLADRVTLANSDKDLAAVAQPVRGVKDLALRFKAGLADLVVSENFGLSSGQAALPHKDKDGLDDLSLEAVAQLVPVVRNLVRKLKASLAGLVDLARFVRHLPRVDLRHRDRLDGLNSEAVLHLGPIARDRGLRFKTGPAAPIASNSAQRIRGSSGAIEDRVNSSLNAVLTVLRFKANHLVVLVTSNLALRIKDNPEVLAGKANSVRSATLMALSLRENAVRREVLADPTVRVDLADQALVLQNQTAPNGTGH